MNLFNQSDIVQMMGSLDKKQNFDSPIVIGFSTE